MTNNQIPTPPSLYHPVRLGATHPNAHFCTRTRAPIVGSASSTHNPPSCHRCAGPLTPSSGVASHTHTHRDTPTLGGGVQCPTSLRWRRCRDCAQASCCKCCQFMRIMLLDIASARSLPGAVSASVCLRLSVRLVITHYTFVSHSVFSIACYK